MLPKVQVVCNIESQGVNFLRKLIFSPENEEYCVICLKLYKQQEETH